MEVVSITPPPSRSITHTYDDPHQASPRDHPPPPCVCEFQRRAANNHMCSVAPFALPASSVELQSTMAMYVEAPARCPAPAYASAADHVEGRVQVVSAAASAGSAAPDLAAHREDDDAPTTPVAVLKAPTISYGDDINSSTGVIHGDAKKKTDHDKMKEDPSWAYDDSIDATFRKLERDPAERPSEDYNWMTQDGSRVMMGDRADLVGWMYAFARFHGLAPGALHRAVNYVDRFMSSNKIVGGGLYPLGGAAVLTAAKYEDSQTRWVVNADVVADRLGCTRRLVLAAERDLIAALRYRLSGPTAYTFVEHFTRYDDDQEGEAVRSLAHHLTDVTLLDYRCAPLLPSAVAAAAILLARSVVIGCTAPWSEELIKMTGYTIPDLIDIIDAIYDMHDLEEKWPGCALVLTSRTYSLPPR
jgi:cyclin-A